MKENFGWLVMALAIVASTIIYACATRYELFVGGTVLDRWTGRVHYGDVFKPSK